MKKIIAGVVLLAFLFAAMPLYAMDHNPYQPPRISDKPDGDIDPWDDLQKSAPGEDQNSDSAQVNEEDFDFRATNTNVILDFIKKLIPNGLKKRSHVESRKNIAVSKGIHRPR
jgi:hypothetical protein